MTADQHQAVAQGHVTVRLVPEEAVRDVPHAGMTRHVEAAPETGHIDPAAAARWHQAQSELASLIRDENQAIGQVPEGEREVLLPRQPGGRAGNEGSSSSTRPKPPSRKSIRSAEWQKYRIQPQVRGGPAPPLTA